MNYSFLIISYIRLIMIKIILVATLAYTMPKHHLAGDNAIKAALDAIVTITLMLKDI